MRQSRKTGMSSLMKAFLRNLLLVLMVSTASHAASETLPVLRFPLSISLENFDPTEAEDFITVRVLLNLGRGLTQSDKNLKPVLALAQNFKVSQDKKTYTFKLKKAQWSDGKYLTAMDFITGFERTFSSSTKAKISQNLQEIVVGAKDYKLGKIKDFSQVGVKALDEKTLQIELIRPAGYFLSLLTLPFSFPQREKTIKAGTPTIGPYFISELKSSSKTVLKPNPYFEKPPKNQVELKVITESASMLSLYEKGELDALEKVPSSDFERFKNSPEMVSAPFLATYYLGFNITQKPFDDPKIRKAIYSSIDRSDLSKILKDPQIVASSLVPTPLPSSDHKFAFKVSKDEKTKAADLVKNLELAMDSQEKNILIASLIQQQIKKSMNVDLKIKTMEWKSYINYLTHEHPAFFRFAWLAAFPDPLSHLNIFTSQNPNNYTGYANPEYDQLVQKVAELSPSPLRTSLIIQAQKLLLEKDAVIMPLYHYRNYYLISSRWRGLEATPMGILYWDRAYPKTAP